MRLNCSYSPTRSGISHEVPIENQGTELELNFLQTRSGPGVLTRDCLPADLAYTCNCHDRIQKCVDSVEIIC